MVQKNKISHGTRAGFYPSFIDIRRSYPQTKEKELRGMLWLQLVSRPLSVPGAWVAARIGLSANAVTWLSFVLGLLALVVLAQGGKIWSLVGFVGLMGVYWLDCIDGQLARVAGVGGKMGKYLDDAIGAMIFSLSWVAIGIGLALEPDGFSSHVQSLDSIAWIFSPGALLWFGMSAALFWNLRKNIGMRFKLAEEAIKVAPEDQKNRRRTPLSGVLKLIIANLGSWGGVLLPLLLLSSLVGVLSAVLVGYSLLYGVMLVGSFLRTTIYATRESRRLAPGE